jgi:hypothetical protein
MDCRVKPGNDEDGPSPQIHFDEEVMALSSMMVKAGEILDPDAPDHFHAGFGLIIHQCLLCYSHSANHSLNAAQYYATIASGGRAGRQWL